MMGWMHDTLEYFKRDPIHRKWHQNEITFSIMYAFTENFMLPLSHDEVVHGKGSLMDRMPGDEWQRFANMRLLFGYMYAHPGTKLLFMGGEMAQTTEWKHDESLQWHLLEHGYHLGVQNLIKDLNHLYKETPALHDLSFEKEGFEWIDYSDNENSVVTFARFGKSEDDVSIVVCNFTPALHYTYRVGVPKEGKWKEVLNSDDKRYSGTGLTNGSVETTSTPYHGKDQSLVIKLPPLGITIFSLEK
jgi:1,4-alpha-glucan branching enzyme